MSWCRYAALCALSFEWDADEAEWSRWYAALRMNNGLPPSALVTSQDIYLSNWWVQLAGGCVGMLACSCLHLAAGDGPKARQDVVEYNMMLAGQSVGPSACSQP